MQFFLLVFIVNVFVTAVFVIPRIVSKQLVNDKLTFREITGSKYLKVNKNVIDFVNDVLDNPAAHIWDGYTIYKGADKALAIWSSNDICNRRFYTSSKNEDEIKKINEMNEELSYSDRVILDKVCKALIIAQKSVKTSEVAKSAFKVLIEE